MYFTQKFIQVSKSGNYKENMELVERLSSFFASYPEGCVSFKGNMKKMFEFTKDRIEKNFHTGEGVYDYLYEKEFCSYLAESFRSKLSEEIGFWWPNEENRGFWQDSMQLMNVIFYKFQRVLLIEEMNRLGFGVREKVRQLRSFDWRYGVGREKLDKKRDRMIARRVKEFNKKCCVIK